MNKILIRLYVPIMEKKYDVWLPLDKKISSVIVLLLNAINDLEGGYYRPEDLPNIYDRVTGEMYNSEISIRQSGMKNGTEIILI